MNYKLVFHILGLILRVEAVLMLPAAVIAGLYRDGDLGAFLLSAGVTLLAGQLLCMLPGRGTKMQARDGFAAVALSWIVLSLFGALPYVFSGVLPNYVDAVFETVSGFTTTGATVFTFIEGQPRGVLFWRAQTQWMGGVGVLVLALALVPKLGEGSVYLMRAESPGPIKSKLTPRLNDTAKILYSIYIGLTVGEAVCLRLAGMPWYDAVIHAFTTISTGGFSVKDASIAAYGSLVIEWIIIIFMFLSGINFALLYFALCRNFKAVFQSEELRSYTWMTAIASGLIVCNLVLHAGWAMSARTVTDSVFQVVTLMTTTGYMTYDYVLWPTFSQVILIMVMFAGACAGSTAGGIKQIRVVLLVKNLRREVQRILHPRVVTTIRSDGDRVEEATLSGITLFFFAYILLLLVGALVVAWDDVGFTAAFTASLTCISNVGPAFDVLGPTCNFSPLSEVSKVLLSLNMLLGRLEIMPLLLLLFPSLWKKR
ncbi:MAG: TrkH family potassium uptake protein [Oscillospiraceae bacterium]|jgi:trk system potassium uptake protein TrkH|nr:TrkH family potassium uptake protein [Oscillospiraceae bacterium]